MDQTFLRNDGTFDQEHFSKILNRLDQHQIKFVAASGRSLWLIEDIFGKKLGKRIDYVAENGGFVMADGQKIAGEGISADVLRQAESFCAKHFSKNYLITIMHQKKGLTPMEIIDIQNIFAQALKVPKLPKK